MVELGIAVLVGIIIGAGGAVGVQQATKKPEPVVVAVGGDEVAKGQVEVQKQLIDLDLLVVYDAFRRLVFLLLSLVLAGDERLLEHGRRNGFVVDDLEAPHEDVEDSLLRDFVLAFLEHGF